MPIPLIDLFAGPGGLGEGFSAYRSEERGQSFKIVLSIEKDYWAHQTLELRSFFRKFSEGCVPEAYYQYLRGEINKAALFEKHPEQAEAAQQEAWKAELGKERSEEIDRRITRALKGNQTWVLVGGPPCQAYSTVGRSRMQRISGDDYNFETDHRHFLYREYLRILRRHNPPVFVMENVKGLLSATVNGVNMFDKIHRDLRRRAGNTPGYHIHSFVKHDDSEKLEPTDYTIHSESYGVPQMRHRVILLGIRKDLKQGYDVLQESAGTPTTRDAIHDLPRIRSTLSKEKDSFPVWLSALEEIFQPELLNGFPKKRALLKRLDKSVEKARKGRWKCSGDDTFFVSRNGLKPSSWLTINRDWFVDTRLGGACNHGARSHMRRDLVRYLFASAYAAEKRSSPFLRHFPEGLLPEHRNVKRAMRSDNFADRFRVQVASKPATTVVSHIAKDGHYYIHYDPSQCRSLTVREAARLQTFPDNYFFEGPRTQQYYQVGNAVPPLLARQLAQVVQGILVNNAVT